MPISNFSRFLVLFIFVPSVPVTDFGCCFKPFHLHNTRFLFFFSNLRFFIFRFVAFRNRCKVSIFEMLVCHKTESNEMPVQGGDSINAVYDEDSIALAMAISESHYES